MSYYPVSLIWKKIILISRKYQNTYVNELTYNLENGLDAKVNAKQMECFKEIYEQFGYTIIQTDNQYIVKCNPKVFCKNPPQFIHKYIDKTFLSIPALYFAEPFKGIGRYSQLCITFVIAYFLGMIVRYYPTHWISLIQGEKVIYMAIDKQSANYC